jgi:hypothetical protein
MVLQGQDAWRRHPLLSGLWKKPLPHFGTAVGLFGAYLIADYMFDKAMKVPDAPRKSKVAYAIPEDAPIGDVMPEAHMKGGHH